MKAVIRPIVPITYIHATVTRTPDIDTGGCIESS